MLQFRTGLWQSKEDSKSYSSVVTIHGVKYAVFVDEVENRKSNTAPHKLLTIKEYRDDK